jgi:hypothetical protein
MGYMKKYKCPKCFSTQAVIRQTKRGKSILYKCKNCIKYFSIKTVHTDKKALLNDHLDGLSFRKLAVKYQLSPMSAWRVCEEALQKLPDNNKFTFKYCSRFSDIFVFDGKYFTVKGHQYGYVLLWGIDYLRHDIPIFTLAPSENYSAWATNFSYFRIINHYPRLVVCDDNTNLKMAARNTFPAVKIQTCFNHFKENIRRDLRVRSDTTYKPFMKRIEDVLREKLNDASMNKKLFALFRDYRSDPVCVQVLANIERYRPELTGYRGMADAPVTTNIIEGLNSHLESRLFSLRSFQSLAHAKLWFNGYILKRRFTKFTDCRGKFRSLNGKKGVDLTKKPEIDLPTFF